MKSKKINKENFGKLLGLVESAGLVTLAILKAFFYAVTQVAWGIGGVFLLNLLLVYFIKGGIPYEMDKTFLMLEEFLVNNIMIFFWVFAVWSSYFNIKEVCDNIKHDTKKKN